MRLVIIGLAILAVVLTPLARARTIIDAGYVAVQMHSDRMHHCVVDVDPEICPVAWQTHETQSPSDDTIVLEKRIDEVRVVARAPFVPEKSVAADPKQALD